MKKFETIKKFEAMETDQLQKIVGGDQTYVAKNGDVYRGDGTYGTGPIKPPFWA